FALAYAMWFVLYLSIIVYGVTVMGAVVEEKTSRVIEILASSVRPFQLLAGKIVGVGAVGLFQLLIWGICATFLLNHQKEVMHLLRLPMTSETPSFPHMSLVTAAVFLGYFILGYFLYAAMFAAVASTSSSEAEARQAQTPVVMLLVVPSVLMVGILNDPNGSLAHTLGLVPFFSPVSSCMESARLCVSSFAGCGPASHSIYLPQQTVERFAGGVSPRFEAGK